MCEPLWSMWMLCISGGKKALMPCLSTNWPKWKGYFVSSKHLLVHQVRAVVLSSNCKVFLWFITNGFWFFPNARRLDVSPAKLLEDLKVFFAGREILEDQCAKKQQVQRPQADEGLVHQMKKYDFFVKCLCDLTSSSKAKGDGDQFWLQMK